MDFRARYDASAGSARNARHALLLFATSCGFRDAALRDIELGVGEAIANAIEHGSRNSGHFEVTAVFGDGKLTVEVSNEGKGFDPDGMTANRSDFRGWGVYLMRSVLDDVSYSDDGKRVRLEKNLPVANGSENRPANGSGTG